MDNLLITLLNLVFPDFCLGCGRCGYVVCADCLKKLSWIETPVCVVCDKPAIQGYTHAGCLTGFAPERLISLFRFEGLVKSAVHKSKYSQKAFRIFEVLVEIWNRGSPEFFESFGKGAVFVSIPLHAAKLRKRGFNQSEVIARALAKKSGGFVCTGVLVRVVEGSVQAGLQKEARKQNVKGVFECKSEFVRGKDIVLVDDVCTTGATLLEASRVLKQSGARFVWCVTLAKAGRD